MDGPRWENICKTKPPGLEQSALSLSHLTYVDATITVNFHRLDHPPFPCSHKILQRRSGLQPRDAWS